jgi:D-alanyl-D-alanine dipeptidase
MAILLSDPRVLQIPVRENGEPLVLLEASFGPARALVRKALAERLIVARDRLPSTMAFRVVEGLRSAAAELAIVARYSAELAATRPGIGTAELYCLCSRFVAPIEVAPHVAGAGVDLTMVDAQGNDLDLGTPIDATPEQSGGRCYFAASGLSRQVRANRTLLAQALGGAGLVNCPSEWWHWSYGDRYWALTTGAPAALYGPVDVADPAGLDGPFRRCATRARPAGHAAAAGGRRRMALREAPGRGC